MNFKYEFTFGVTIHLKKGNKMFFLDLECLSHCPNATFQLCSTLLCNPQKQRKIQERKISRQKKKKTTNSKCYPRIVFINPKISVMR